jgi:hypothetical protein
MKKQRIHRKLKNLVNLLLSLKVSEVFPFRSEAYKVLHYIENEMMDLMKEFGEPIYKKRSENEHN